jgi:hypothetical protein
MKRKYMQKLTVRMFEGIDYTKIWYIEFSGEEKEKENAWEREKPLSPCFST